MKKLGILTLIISLTVSLLIMYGHYDNEISKFGFLILFIFYMWAMPVWLDDLSNSIKVSYVGFIFSIIFLFFSGTGNRLLIYLFYLVIPFLIIYLMSFIIIFNNEMSNLKE